MKVSSNAGSKKPRKASANRARRRAVSFAHDETITGGPASIVGIEVEYGEIEGGEDVCRGKVAAGVTDAGVMDHTERTDTQIVGLLSEPMRNVCRTRRRNSRCDSQCLTPAQSAEK